MAERRVIDNVYLLWAVLALPAAWLIVQRYMLHGDFFFLALSGKWAAWLFVATMAVTPLQMIVGPLPWLRKRRRYIGVATFGYSLLHLVVWLTENNIRAVVKSFIRPEIVTGWIGFAMLIALAMTSTDEAVRRHGPKWKKIQRWIYPAAVFTFLHWIMTAEHEAQVWILCAPIIVASAWRLIRYRLRMRRT